MEDLQERNWIVDPTDVILCDMQLPRVLYYTENCSQIAQKILQNIVMKHLYYCNTWQCR